MNNRVSLFDSVQAQSVVVRRVTPSELVDFISGTQAAQKVQLPLLKLGFFGDYRTRNGSLRHDRNLHFVSGVELDYDGEQVSFDDAVAIAEKLPLLSIIYTSPSHTPSRPRWRLLAPTSQEYPAKDRTCFVERINGAYGGIFSSESWTASQSFYFGRIIGDPNFRITLIEGEPVDQLDELDLIARGKAHIGAGGNGHAFEGSTAGLTEAQLEKLIRSGAHYHQPTLRLATNAARRGDDQREVEDRILDLFDAVPPELQNRERWAPRRAEVHRCVADMYFGVEREQGEAAEREAAGLADLEARSGVAPASDRIEPDPAEPQPEPPRGNGHDPEAETGSADPQVGAGAGGGNGSGGGGGGGTSLPPPSASEGGADEGDENEGGDNGGAGDSGGGDPGDDSDPAAAGDLPPPDWDIPDLDDDDILVQRRKSLQRHERLIAYFNGRYACVNEAGKFWIFEQRRDAMLRRDVLDHIKRSDFCAFYENRRLAVWDEQTGKFVTKTWADWWLKDVRRRQYDGVVLDPTGKHSNGLWNLWRGYGVTPAPGDWGLMREHIERVICSGVPEWSEYLLNWIANMLQCPDRPGEVAVVTRGVEGCGKGILGRALVRMLGTHGLQITDAGNLVGRFSEHLRDLVFLFADEAFFAGDKKHEGRLKALITEPQMTIEGKYKAVITVRNYLHVLIGSNNDWVVPASLRARRWAAFQVLDTHVGDKPYFAAIVQQLQAGGLAGMLYELLHRDLSEFDVRDVPQTGELQVQKKLSLPSAQRWWLTVLTRGYLWSSRHGVPWFRDWHEFYTMPLLMQSYLQWASSDRPYDRQSREQLGMFFHETYQWSRPRRGVHPVQEIENINWRAIEGVQDSSGGWIKLPSTLDDEAIIWKDHIAGYRVGDLDEARARFLAAHKIQGAPLDRARVARTMVRAWSGRQAPKVAEILAWSGRTGWTVRPTFLFPATIEISRSTCLPGPPGPPGPPQCFCGSLLSLHPDHTPDHPDQGERKKVGKTTEPSIPGRWEGRDARHPDPLLPR